MAVIHETVLFTELFEFVDEETPTHAQHITKKKSTHGKQYWRERHRWLDFEEIYDPVVEEFSPPDVPSFRYDHLSSFKKAIKKDLSIVQIEGTNVKQVLNKLSDTCCTDAANILLAPHVHPEILEKHSSENMQSAPINQAITECCDKRSKSCCIFAGLAPELRESHFVLAKVVGSVEPNGLVEVPFPLKFIIISLTPDLSKSKQAFENGRILGTFLTHKRFQEACSKTENVSVIVDACKLFLKKTYVQSRQHITNDEAPIDTGSFWSELFQNEDSALNSELDTDLSSDNKTEDDSEEMNSCDDDPIFQEREGYCGKCMHRIFPPMRDVCNGFVTVCKRYASDFKDAFTKENISVTLGSLLFIYFVIFAPAITFGTLMHRQVNSAFTVSNSILTSGFSAIIYALFAGQPIAVVGPSGPGFIMERLIARSATEYGMDFFIFRFWVLLYAILMGFFLMGLNLSEIAMRASRSMEELFSAAISGFLIIKALFSIFTPIPQDLPRGDTGLNNTSAEILHVGAIASTNAFIALVMTCFNLTIVKFKKSNLISRKTRFWIGAMNVPLGIIFTIGVDKIWFQSYNIDHLKIPPTAKLNYTEWFSFPDLSKLQDYGTSGTATHVHGVAFIYGSILGFLIFIEIALNSIVALRGRSIKPSPIAIDHFLACIIFPLMAMFLGLPLMSGVPIRTIANMVALAHVDQHTVPGKAPSWYLVEQRVNTLIVGILVTVSVFLGDILQYIPVASLFGLFLFLGIFGLRGLQFKQIFTALLSRKKYWKQWKILDGLPRKPVYVFTFIWLGELSLLIILLILGEFEGYVMISTAIPFVLLAAFLIREVILPKWKWMAAYLEKIDPPCAPEYKLARATKHMEILQQHSETSI